MLFELVRIREKGWVLPRHRQANRVRPRGHLRVDEEQDNDLNRTVRIARFLDSRTKRPLPDILPLYDVTLLCVSDNYISLAGFERFHDPLAQRDFDYAQSWILYPAESDWDAGLYVG